MSNTRQPVSFISPPVVTIEQNWSQSDACVCAVSFNQQQPISSYSVVSILIGKYICLYASHGISLFDLNTGVIHVGFGHISENLDDVTKIQFY